MIQAAADYACHTLHAANRWPEALLLTSCCLLSPACSTDLNIHI